MRILCIIQQHNHNTKIKKTWWLWPRYKGDMSTMKSSENFEEDMYFNYMKKE